MTSPLSSTTTRRTAAGFKAALGATLLFLGQAAVATPFDIADTYFGADDHGHGDVIGSDAFFDIQGANVSRTGNILTIDIFTSFFTDMGSGQTGLGSCPCATFSGNGIGAGDLFLADSWDPHGTGPEYLADNSANGTEWDYGFSLDNRWSTGGTGAWYSLGGAANSDIILSDAFINCCTYRNGQEIAVDTGHAGVSELIGAGNTWTVDTVAQMVTFQFDVTGTSPATSESVALHWAMTCGNDTIEGEVTGLVTTSVPEPTSLLFASLGLLLLAGSRRQNVRRIVAGIPVRVAS